MQYPLSIEGFEGHELVVETGGFFGGSQVLIDNQPARRGTAPGQFMLRRSDDTEVLVQLRHNLLDPVPVVTVAGQPVFLVEPFAWMQRLLAGLSLLVVLILSAGGLLIMHRLPRGGMLQVIGVVMMVICGLLGALAGFVSMIINGRVLRSEMSQSARLFVIGALTIAVVITYLIVFILLMGILSLFEGLGTGHVGLLMMTWPA